MPYKDLEKRISYSKEYNKKHYKERKKYYSDKKKKRIKDAYELVNKIKEKPCMDCGGVFLQVAMDFDHRDSALKFKDIARMILNGYSDKRILEEIAKCDLICSNCHRVRTWRRLREKK